MVLLRLVMQDNMRAFFNVWPEVIILIYVDDKKFNLQAKRAEETAEAARKVYEELK